MRPVWLGFLLFVAGCSSGRSADLQYIKQARSIGAEWALINEQAQARRVTPKYARSMHYWLHDNLQTAASSLTEPNSAYGAEMQLLLAEPADASPQQLRSHSEALKRIEDGLEST
ncbi:hypothetical protein [Sphingomonas sp. URHD0057]|uniref:hypothetical protein n=1 Tax=Sphingomonas sp. URHD0057 TaxID=1380389 RepID=UPI00048B84A1|nr:hypothetical protein [Sphingomonas sp. URHD0057]